MKGIKKVPMDLIAVLVVMLVLTAGSASAEIQSDSGASVSKSISPVLEDAAPRQVIVGFEDAFVTIEVQQEQQHRIETCGGRVLQRNIALNYVLVEVAEGKKIQEFIEEITTKEGKKVRYAEPNYIVEIQHTPNDPLYTSQWGPQAIKADNAWDTQQGNLGVTIAIIDTGIDYTHEDLGNYVPGGWDYVNDDPDPMDDNGHGTHCAGIATAVMDNGKGIAGIAQVSVMAVKVLDAGGSGYTSDVADGIINATDKGADVISLSLGSSSSSSTMRDACQYAYDNGCVIVGAAGNSNTSIIYPAAYDTVIAVGALNRNHTRCNSSDWSPGRGSCYGPELELMAPGNDILSTVPLFDDATGYSEKSGTSMAAPHVAGVAALVWSNCPAFTNVEVREHLDYTADDLGDLGLDQYYGWGRVDVEDAIDCSAVPDIDVNPGSFDLSIVENGTRDYTLTISNTGGLICAFEKYSNATPEDIAFSDDFESGAGGWTHGGDEDEWELGTPTSGPSSAYSGSSCWGTDLTDTYQNYADEWLMSEAVDLSCVHSASLIFWRWYELESTYDPAYVEISTDNGTNWIELRKYTHDEKNWTKEEIDVSAYTGYDEVRIRFRLESDYSTCKAGLYIDDVQICVPWLYEDVHGGSVYPGTSTNVTITCDTIGLSPGTYNRTIVVISNDPDEDRVDIPVNLTVLAGGDPDIRVSPTSFDVTIGQGLVTEKNLTVGNDGTGVLWLYNITDTVDWLDESPTAGRVYVNEHENITVTFDATGLVSGVYTTTIAIENSDPDENITNVPVTVTVLPPDIWVSPASFDLDAPKGAEITETLVIGNDGAGVLTYDITDTAATTLIDDDFESGAGGWTHGGDEDEWELGTPASGPSGAYSGSNCWGTDLNDTYQNDADEWLMSEAIDLSGVSRASLSFRRWYAIESGWDHGYVEISTNNTTGPWIELEEYNGYEEAWTKETIDISAHTGFNEVRIRFRLDSDYSVNKTGMYIDDVVVEGDDWETEDPESGTVYPGETVTVNVTIGPLDLGTYNATIIIANNDPDENPTNVTKNVTVEPADIWIDPDGFDVTLNSSETWNGTLTIGNNGPGVLWYEVPDAMMPEGFEDGKMPPAGWQHIKSSTNTWDIGTSSHSGDYAALCNWGFSGDKQDEWLISEPLDMSDWTNTELSFWWMSSYYWMVDPYDNFDVLVKVSIDGGNNWDTVWTSGDIGEFANWEWYDTTFGTPIDLSMYEGNPGVLIAWHFYGEDTGEFLLDDIAVTMGDQDCLWLDVHPMTGTVDSGNNENITVMIDATGIPSGDHNANIVIDNNDPNTMRFVPVNLTVHVSCGCVGENRTFPCGSTVTESCTFNCDLNCSAGTHGLIVGADGITIDGTGHTITGDNDGYNVGIYNHDGFDDVIVKDLEVTGFSTGIRISNADNNTIDTCTVYDNGNAAIDDPATTHGIDLYPYVCNSCITDSNVYNNTGMSTGGCDAGGMGIRLVQYSNYNSISGNTVYDNAVAGIYSKQGCMHNNVSRNTVTGNGVNGGSFTGGIRLQCKQSNYWAIWDNRVTATNGPGIYIGSSDNLIRNNTVRNNTGNGIDMGRSDGSFDNELYENTVCDNGDTDISTYGAGSGTTGDSNTCDTTSDYDDTGTTGCTYSCSGHPGICGDVTCNGVVDTGDVILLSNYVGYYPGNPNYALDSTQEWAGDVTGNGVIDTGDVILLSNYVGYPGYALNCTG